MDPYISLFIVKNFNLCYISRGKHNAMIYITILEYIYNSVIFQSCKHSVYIHTYIHTDRKYYYLHLFHWSLKLILISCDEGKKKLASVLSVFFAAVPSVGFIDSLLRAPDGLWFLNGNHWHSFLHQFLNSLCAL